MLAFDYGFLSGYASPMLGIFIHKNVIYFKQVKKEYFAVVFDGYTDYIGEANSISPFYDNKDLVHKYPDFSEDYFQAKLEFARSQIVSVLCTSGVFNN
jgi:hypothetical protein